MEDMELVDRCWDTHNELISSREPDRVHNKIETWFKNEEDLGSITMCGRTIVNASIMDVLAVFGEVDLIDSFIDEFEKIEVIKQFSNFRILNTCKLKMPLFVEARDLVTMGIGITLQEEKSVLLAMKSVEGKYLGTPCPNESNTHKRIFLNFGFYLLTFIDETHTELSFGINVDPKVPMIPWFMLNTFLKEIAYYILLNYRDQIEKLDKTVYEKRRLERREFYEEIKERITFVSKNLCDIPD